MDPLTDDRLTLVGLFIESTTALRSVLGRRLEQDVDMPLQWFELLLRLARSPGRRLRMSDLATQASLTPSGLTRAVDRLSEAGLVERVACPEDRRVAYAALTEVGLSRVTSAVRPHLRDIDELVNAALTPPEREQFGALLRKLRDHVNPQATVVTTPEPTPEPTAGAGG
jgi:DNA-binding MarR family transcriptional regulator